MSMIATRSRRVQTLTLKSALAAWDRADAKRREMDACGRVPQAMVDSVMGRLHEAGDALRDALQGRAWAVIGGRLIQNTEATFGDDDIPVMAVLSA